MPCSACAIPYCAPLDPREARGGAPRPLRTAACSVRRSAAAGCTNCRSSDMAEGESFGRLGCCAKPAQILHGFFDLAQEDHDVVLKRHDHAGIAKDATAKELYRQVWEARGVGTPVDPLPSRAGELPLALLDVCTLDCLAAQGPYVCLGLRHLKFDQSFVADETVGGRAGHGDGRMLDESSIGNRLEI